DNQWKRYCSPSDFPAIIQAAKEHEGIVYSPDSHVQVYKDWLHSHLFMADWEKTVFRDGDIDPAQTPSTKAADFFDAAIFRPSLADVDQHHTVDPIPGRVPPALLPCKLRHAD
ncbi:MAG TPA: hypothetical protein VFE05_01470, partial [Longimicrobiaceae bacterium]|nr:hypothetical protein [Longimicrobiaceae bacterium]